MDHQGIIKPMALQRGWLCKQCAYEVENSDENLEILMDQF